MKTSFVAASLTLVFVIALQLSSYACAEESQGFESDVKAFRLANKIPGLAVGIVKDKELTWSIGLGYADSNRTVPITADTPFWIASVSKTFVALPQSLNSDQCRLEISR